MAALLDVDHAARMVMVPSGGTVREPILLSSLLPVHRPLAKGSAEEEDATTSIRYSLPVGAVKLTGNNEPASNVCPQSTGLPPEVRRTAAAVLSCTAAWGE